MRIELAKDPNLWDAYVRKLSPPRNYHLWSWRAVIEEVFGHQAYYLAAVDDDTIRGVLPLVSMRSRLFGNFLVSIPFFSYGGVLTDNDLARDMLLSYASELAVSLRASHIELRQGDACDTAWKETSPKVTMEITLPTDCESYWRSLSSGLRNKIRQGRKHKLRAVWGGINDLPTFYRIFAINMRNLGTPVYPRRFFEAQLRRHPEDIRILTMWDGDQPVASSFLTRHQDTLELPWSASLRESRKKYSQVLMYWTFMEKAIQEGVQKIDLGRCTHGSGTWEFKRHWNAIERPLHWYYWSKADGRLPALRADNPKFRIATAVWKRLPVTLTNGVGPWLVRSIP